MRSVRYTVELVLQDRFVLTRESLRTMWEQHFHSDDEQHTWSLSPEQKFFRLLYEEWCEFITKREAIPTFRKWGQDLRTVVMTHQYRLQERGKKTLAETRIEPGSVQVQNMTETLHDFHQVILKARRNRCGDFVWCSWVADQYTKRVRNQTPCGGANILALTVRGARQLLPWWRRQSPGPMGKRWTEAMWEMQNGTMEMCYVMPPMGTPFAHESGTSGMSSGRPRKMPSNWGKKWTRPGTSGGARDEYWDGRKLCHYTKKGSCIVITEVGAAGHGPESWWLSRAPECIRCHEIIQHPELVTDYRSYREDRCRGGLLGTTTNAPAVCVAVTSRARCPPATTATTHAGATVIVKTRADQETTTPCQTKRYAMAT